MWIHELYHACRNLLRQPVISGVAIVSLALALGINTAVFTLVHRLLLEPVLAPEPDRLTAVFTVDAQDEAPGGAQNPLSYLNFRDLREAVGGLELVAYQTVPVGMVADGEPEQVQSQVVSEGFFNLMGAEPAHGRFFLPAEEQEPGTHPVVVLAHGFWQRRFAGDPAVIGRTVKLNGHGFEVVGVAREGFHGPTLMRTPDLWAPLAMRRLILPGAFLRFFDIRRALLLPTIGRLERGLSLEQASAVLESASRHLASTYPDSNQGRSFELLPLSQAMFPPHLRPLFLRAGMLLLGVVLLVHLIACANVANLLLARAEGRRHEIAVRMALGSSRTALMRKLVAEGLVLAFAGAGLGIGLAWWTREALWRLRPPILAKAAPSLDFSAPVLGFLLVLTLVTGLLFSLAPAVKAFRSEYTGALRGSRSGSDTGGLGMLPNLLVVGQVALCLFALIGSGLFITSLRQAQDIDPGIDAGSLAVVAYNLGNRGYDPARGRDFHRRALEAAEAVPGVEAATVASNRPLDLGPGTLMRTLFVEGQDRKDPAQGTLVTTNVVAPDYFQTVGTPILRGRALTSADREETRKVAVVSEATVRRFWPDGEAVGRRFYFFGQPEPVEIVGVARDTKVGTLGEAPQPYIYVPLDQTYAEQVHLFVRTEGEPSLLIQPLTAALQELDPELPFTSAVPFTHAMREALWAPRLGALLLGLFGLLALFLATVGIYGVLSYSVRRRQRELAVRAALGAGRRNLLTRVLRRGMTLTALGMITGLALALSLSQWISGLLYGVSGADPITIAMTMALLALVAFWATLLPAYRATQIDPARVLKNTE